MLFPTAVLDRIVTGEVDLAFRRWRRPQHVAGGSQRTQVGVIAFDAVDRVDATDITAAEAARAGTDLEALQTWLAKKDGEVYRVLLRYAGPDEREVLRQEDRLSRAELAGVAAQLAAIDGRSTRGPWTRRYLELVADRPGELAETLAASIGRQRAPFKADMRRLKELGLTESLRVGYRLSPRGTVVLDHLRGRHRPGVD